MKVDIFTLCDNAQEYQGKLVIVGTFNSISSQVYPVKHPEFAVVARIIFDVMDAGKHHEIKVTIKSEEGSIVLLQPKLFSFDIKGNRDAESLVNILVKARDINIPKEGRYIVSLIVDGTEVTSNLMAVKHNSIASEQ